MISTSTIVLITLAIILLKFIPNSRSDSIGFYSNKTTVVPGESFTIYVRLDQTVTSWSINVYAEGPVAPCSFSSTGDSNGETDPSYANQMIELRILK